MTHRRTAVRKYAVDLLRSGVDVGERVYFVRSDDLFLEDLPCINIYFPTEDAKTWTGDDVTPLEYDRGLRLEVCIATEAKVEPGVDERVSDINEDYLDYLGWQVENAFNDDPYFEKNLAGYDETTRGNNKLLIGMRILSGQPYHSESEGDRRVYSSTLLIDLHYETEAFPNKKFDDFNQYRADFVRTDLDYLPEADRILLAAEGDL